LVFTPYYNKVKSIFTPTHLKEFFPVKQKLIKFNYSLNISIESIGFKEQTLNKHQLLSTNQKLEIFKTQIATYTQNRDFMSSDATSGLSIDLRFGTISIRSILRWLVTVKNSKIDTEPFFRQLIFREFYAMLLYHFPYLESQNFRYKFTGVKNNDYLEAFFKGETGVPIVDAGIKQLLENGEMHNRVRMIVSSFFTKNLLLPWQSGEAFFAKHLMDYDVSSNILSWQWSAGTGIDPQPYFRIFNPYTQTKKFDKEGVYIKRHLPQLNSLSAKIFGDENLLRSAEIKNYPRPIVDHKVSSKNALEHFRILT
jgi:deoxyribodipyrimidine photo-lyase